MLLSILLRTPTSHQVPDSCISMRLCCRVRCTPPNIVFVVWVAPGLKGHLQFSCIISETLEGLAWRALRLFSQPAQAIIPRNARATIYYTRFLKHDGDPKAAGVDRSDRILLVGPYQAVVSALTLLQDSQLMQMIAVPWEGGHHEREEAFS